MLNLLLPIWILLSTLSSLAQTKGQDATQITDPLSVESHIEPYQLHPQQGGEIILKMTLPPQFHAYADQFKATIMEPDGFHYGEFKINPIKEFYDKNSKKNRSGIEGAAELRLRFEAPSTLPTDGKNIVMELTYQACSDSYCLFPKTKQLQVPVKFISTAEPPVAASGWSQLSGESVKNALEKNLFLAFLLVFISGILTSFTPCIFPMIPITLAILGQDSQKRSRWQNFLLSVFYVHGIATTYSILGVVAASSGQLFGSSLGHPAVIGTMCLIFFLMALSMYGVFEIQVPAGLRQAFSRHSAGANYFGAYFSGVLAGVVASPCVGPVLVTLLAFVASSQNKLLGFFLLFTYAIGLGVIFLVLGAYTELTRRLPRSGPWMEGMKFVLGSLMLGAFYYYLSFLISPRWHDGLIGLGMIVVSSFFGAFINVGHAGKLRRVQKGLMQGLLVLGIAFIVLSGLDLRPVLFRQYDGPHDINAKVDHSDWQNYDEALLAQAKAQGQPVLIDFFADWCLACHELDEKTFSDPEVKKVISGFVKLRYDATKDSPQLVALRKKYKIMGLPTVVMIDPTGQWREDLSLTQFEKPAAFIQRASALKPR
jgi:thiol:disulfide interchange protein DsbD